MEYKNILGAIAVAITFVSFIWYFRDVFYGQTKPHLFSWLVWGLLELIAYFAQVAKGAGPGAWVTVSSGLLCLCVFVIAIPRGEKNITRLDWISFLGALFGLALWIITKNPLSAVVLASFTDFLGFIPTFRKAYHKPQEETVILYASSCVKLVLAMIALHSFNLTTSLYPASLLVTNALFVTMVLIRRKQKHVY